ncbi:hypothetical protein ABZX75_04655 [Streptomyces sp. NPDC003038]|uniref:hypothetical protein n=1 Tax=unclassified Streptomyces TaxID=2593676 RepID=UPI0033B09D0C
MTDTEKTAASSYSVTVRGERFTCREVNGLGAQGDGGLPGQVLTITLADCVLTDVPGAREWALSAGGSPVAQDVTIDETAADGEAPRAVWHLTGARPGDIAEPSTTASNHETRIQLLTVYAEKITPDLPRTV